MKKGRDTPSSSCLLPRLFSMYICLVGGKFTGNLVPTRASCQQESEVWLTCTFYCDPSCWAQTRQLHQAHISASNTRKFCFCSGLRETAIWRKYHKLCVCVFWIHCIMLIASHECDLSATFTGIYSQKLACKSHNGAATVQICTIGR